MIILQEQLNLTYYFNESHAMEILIVFKSIHLSNGINFSQPDKRGHGFKLTSFQAQSSHRHTHLDLRPIFTSEYGEN